MDIKPLQKINNRHFYIIIIVLFIIVSNMSVFMSCRHKYNDSINKVENEIDDYYELVITRPEYAIKNGLLSDAVNEFVFNILDSLPKQCKAQYAPDNRYLELTGSCHKSDTSLTIKMRPFKDDMNELNFVGFADINGFLAIFPDSSLISMSWLMETNRASSYKIKVRMCKDSYIQWLFNIKQHKLFLTNFSKVTTDDETYSYPEFDIQKMNIMKDSIVKWNIIDSIDIAEYTIASGENHTLFLLKNSLDPSHLTNEQAINKNNCYILAQHFMTEYYDSNANNHWIEDALGDNIDMNMALTIKNHDSNAHSKKLKKQFFEIKPKYFIEINIRGDLCNIVERGYDAMFNSDSPYSFLDSTQFYKMLIPVWEYRQNEKWYTIKSLRQLCE